MYKRLILNSWPLNRTYDNFSAIIYGGYLVGSGVAFNGSL